jgi:hypothetical protein
LTRLGCDRSGIARSRTCARPCWPSKSGWPRCPLLWRAVDMRDEEVFVPAIAKPEEPAASGRYVRVRPSDLAWRQAGDEVVVLDLAASSYHALNASGALLWKRLAGWTTAKELTATLVSSFGLTPDAAAWDVAGFLDGCADAGLIEIRAER